MFVGSINLEQAAKLVEQEMTLHRAARRAGNPQSAWQALERAHIVSRPFFGLHLASHGRMLGFAIALGAFREAAGQIFRLALVRFGSLSGRLPVGNAGRARISAFRPVPVPLDLAELISSHDKPASY